VRRPSALRCGLEANDSTGSEHAIASYFRMIMNLLKSILHNIGVVIVGLGIAFLGTKVDSLLSIPPIASSLAHASGLTLLAVGFLLRVWATVHFYAHKML
jgi:hypothetical protein